MKNVFGIKQDYQVSENNIDGKVFLTHKTPKEHEIKFNNNEEILNELKKKTTLPLALRVIKFLSFIISIIFIGGILRSKVSISTAYKNAPYFFYIAGICLILGLTLYIVEKSKLRKLVESEYFKETLDKIEKDIEDAKQILGIPQDAYSLDVLTFTYKENDQGERKICTSRLFQFINLDLYAYVKDDCLCFASVYEVLSIPLKSLIEIKEINKKASLAKWNKEVSYNAPEYKQYKIREANGILFIKPYYSIIINDPLGEFEIYIPCYDIDKIVQLTNLNIVKE
ncbi:MAG TPA: hypothetical protein VIK84_06720 [Haloplasmataceae bacterium]